jgi:hypothetical protein
MATSIVQSTSPPAFAVGQRARDAAGNEYVFVDFVGSVFGAQPVEIFDDNTAQALGTTGRARVGVACGAATSNDFGWVQIYGRCQVQLGMSGVSPSDAANGPTTLQTVAAMTVFCLATSLTTPNGVGWVSGEAGITSNSDYIIENMWVATDASPGDVSAVTSATSHTGNQIAVFLNYPRIRQLDYVSTS